MALFTGIELCAGVGMLGDGVGRKKMKYIPGYEGLYSATKEGKIFSHRSGRFLSPSRRGGLRAYLGVALVDIDGRKKSHYVHTLVLLTFIGLRPFRMVARHKDGNGINNTASNLSWSEHSTNLMDKHAHGTMTKGEIHHQCVISDESVRRLIEERKTGRSYPALGRMFGISTSQAHRICTGQNRKDARCG